MSKRGKVLEDVVIAEEIRPETLPTRGIQLSWVSFAVFAGALVLTFVLYWSSVKAPFLFDDIGLSFYAPTFPHESLKAWLRGVRPVLFLTYWLSYQISGRETWGYHLIGIAIHAINSSLAFVLFRKILVLNSVEKRRALVCALIGAIIFLAHPLQAESVAYIAGRSELVCGLFTLGALVVFCNAGTEPITWRRAAAVMVLYGCAVLSKEQAAVLPAILFGLDMALWRRTAAQAFRRGIRLYAPLLAAGALAVIGVALVLTASTTAGFRVPGMHWYEYLFTQFRMWVWYVRLAILPISQNADYDVPLSHTLTEHGAAAAALVLAVAAVSITRVRFRYPVLFCGCLLFAALLLPTSSIIPLQDLAAERRMYLPLAGLVLVLLEYLTRVQRPELPGTMVGAYIIFCCILTQQRSAVWASDIALWTDVTHAAPLKVRGHTHLAYAYMRTGRCHDAVNAAVSAPSIVQGDAMFMAVLGQAYACDHHISEAIDAYERAVLIEPSVGRMLALASVYRQANRLKDAELMERQALQYPPRSSYDETMLRALSDFRSRSSSSRPETPNQAN